MANALYYYPLDRLKISALIGVSNIDGGVAEWSKAAVLKTVVPQGTVGSNPTSSAYYFIPNITNYLTTS